MKSAKPVFWIVSLAFSFLGVVLIAVALYSVVSTAREISQIRNDLKSVLSKLNTNEDALFDSGGTEPQAKIATIGDAKALVEKLGENPSAESLAEALVAMDAWLIKPEQEEAFKIFKLEHISVLRKLVKAEVGALQDAALQSPTSSEGVKQLADAKRILVMYPMSDDPAVLEEAKLIHGQLDDIATRLEALRRQRYNQWATGQIEKALNFYNAKVSYFNPFNDNSLLIDSLVNHLGEVDPIRLEPAVLELYNYIIDRTKSSINEKNKLELAKRLTDPAIRRKVMEDF